MMVSPTNIDAFVAFVKDFRFFRRGATGLLFHKQAPRAASSGETPYDALLTWDTLEVIDPRLPVVTRAMFPSEGSTLDLCMKTQLLTATRSHWNTVDPLIVRGRYLGPASDICVDAITPVDTVDIYALTYEVSSVHAPTLGRLDYASHAQSEWCRLATATMDYHFPKWRERLATGQSLLMTGAEQAEYVFNGVAVPDTPAVTQELPAQLFGCDSDH